MTTEETTTINDSMLAEATTQQLAAQKAELDSLKLELKNKVYAVRLDTEESLQDLRNFIEEHATWKGLESLGIIEVDKQLAGQKMKAGNVFLKATEVMAVNYFLSKHEGRGLAEAKALIRMVRPVNDALGLIKADNNKLQQLEAHVHALEQGIEMDNGGADATAADTEAGS